MQPNIANRLPNEYHLTYNSHNFISRPNQNFVKLDRLDEPLSFSRLELDIKLIKKLELRLARFKNFFKAWLELDSVFNFFKQKLDELLAVKRL